MRIQLLRAVAHAEGTRSCIVGQHVDADSSGRLLRKPLSEHVEKPGGDATAAVLWRDP